MLSAVGIRRLLRTPRALVGLAIILGVAAAAALAPVLSSYDPTQTDTLFLMPPGSGHLLGTDDLGRDVLSRVLNGGRASLAIGIGAALLATVVGVPVGLLAGYCGGRIDLAATQLMNMFIALPGLVLALLVTAVTGPTLLNIVLILGFVSWPRVARLVRGQALAIREALFVEAARAAGGDAAWIIPKHILPNVAGVIAAQFALTVAYAIFTSSSLSFLGLGIPPPAPDWGGMVRSGLDYLAINPAMGLAPSAAVGLTVLGFYFLGSARPGAGRR